MFFKVYEFDRKQERRLTSTNRFHNKPHSGLRWFQKRSNQKQGSKREQHGNDNGGSKRQIGWKKSQKGRVESEIFHPGSFSRPIGVKKEQLRPTHNPCDQSQRNFTGS